jgi:hypothetical protein
MNTHPNRIHALSESDCALSARGRLALLPLWGLLRSRAAAAIERWRSAEIEDAIQRNGGVMSDSFERDITARVWRSRGL